ncbi:MAG: energy transducer TonB [Bacteroidota bacterium]
MSMSVQKTPRADLKRQYPVVLQVGTLLALGVVLAAFTTPYRAANSFEVIENPIERVALEDIEITRHELPTPPPPRPPAPVEVLDTDIEDPELELEFVLDLSETPPLPSRPPTPATDPEPVSNEVVDFLPLEDQPKLLPSETEALAALQSCIRYPTMAKEAGIQGSVYVQFVVDQRGNVVDPVVARGIGGGADEEAVRCVRELRFRPGMQRGRPVKVQFTLPVTFRLR